MRPPKGEKSSLNPFVTPPAAHCIFAPADSACSALLCGEKHLCAKQIAGSASLASVQAFEILYAFPLVGAASTVFSWHIERQNTDRNHHRYNDHPDVRY